MRNKQTTQHDASTVAAVNMAKTAETATARLTGENVRLTMEIARLNAESNRLAQEINRLAQENERVGQSAEELKLAKSALATANGELSSVQVQSESVAGELRMVRHELGVVRTEVARLVGENQEMDMRGIRADEEFVEVRGELVKLREELQIAEASSAELQSANERMAGDLEVALRLNVAMKDRVSEMEMDEIRASGEVAALRAELQETKTLQNERLRIMNGSLTVARRCISEIGGTHSLPAGRQLTVLSGELETSKVGMGILNGLNAHIAEELVASVSPDEAMKELEQILNQKDNHISDLESLVVSADPREEKIRDNNAHLQHELEAAKRDSESTKGGTRALHAENHVLAKELVATRTQLNSANNSLDMSQDEVKRLEKHIERLVEEAAAKDEEMDATMSEREALRVECNRLSHSNSELEHQKTTLQDDLAAERKKAKASYQSSMSELALVGEKSRQLETVTAELKSATEERSKLQKQNSRLRRALQAAARAQGSLLAENAET
ncbi:hypothetical protein DFP73DRAFT_76643 [Morchella snyderi]|nr:hypothetical protein DFP73DRAFT_76643 [Morchella snyderi]